MMWPIFKKNIKYLHTQTSYNQFIHCRSYRSFKIRQSVSDLSEVYSKSRKQSYNMQVIGSSGTDIVQRKLYSNVHIRPWKMSFIYFFVETSWCSEIGSILICTLLHCLTLLHMLGAIDLFLFCSFLVSFWSWKRKIQIAFAGREQFVAWNQHCTPLHSHIYVKEKEAKSKTEQMTGLRRRTEGNRFQAFKWFDRSGGRKGRWVKREETQRDDMRHSQISLRTVWEENSMRK